MANFPIENRVILTYNNSEVIIMAEFCLECWNRINGTNDPKRKFIMSRFPELCEGCGTWKKTIVSVRISHRMRYLMTEIFCNIKNDLP